MKAICDIHLSTVGRRLHAMPHMSTLFGERFSKITAFLIHNVESDHNSVEQEWLLLSFLIHFFAVKYAVNKKCINYSQKSMTSTQLLDAKLLNIPFPSWFLLQEMHLHFRKKIFQTANNIVNQNSETNDDDNDTTADLGHFEVADELEDDEITSDDEHSIGSDNEHGTLYNQNERESDIDGDDENSTSDEYEQHNDDTLNQSQRIRYSVRQLVKTNSGLCD